MSGGVAGVEVAAAPCARAAATADENDVVVDDDAPLLNADEKDKGPRIPVVRRRSLIALDSPSSSSYSSSSSSSSISSSMVAVSSSISVSSSA